MSYAYVFETDAISIADIFFHLEAGLEIVRHCTKPAESIGHDLFFAIKKVAGDA